MDDFDCFVATVLALIVSHAAILVYALRTDNRNGSVSVSLRSMSSAQPLRLHRRERPHMARQARHVRPNCDTTIGTQALNYLPASTRLTRMRASSRRWRGWFVWIALVSFSFAQLAVAAYVCPNAEDTTRVERSGQGDGDCHSSGGRSHDSDNAQLCKAHCERGAQVKPSALVDPPALAPLALPVVFPSAAPAAVSLHYADSCRAPHGDPPLYLRNCVLRN